MFIHVTVNIWNMVSKCIQNFGLTFWTWLGQPRLTKKCMQKIAVSLGALCRSALDEGDKGKVHPCTGTEALYRPYGL